MTSGFDSGWLVFLEVEGSAKAMYQFDFDWLLDFSIDSVMVVARDDDPSKFGVLVLVLESTVMELIV